MTRLASLFGSLVIGISETSGTMFELSETTEMAEYLRFACCNYFRSSNILQMNNSSLCQLETQLRALNAADNLNDAQQHTINGMLSHLIDKVEAINVSLTSHLQLWNLKLEHTLGPKPCDHKCANRWKYRFQTKTRLRDWQFNYNFDHCKRCLQFCAACFRQNKC